jgi:hypothetical protein
MKCKNCKFSKNNDECWIPDERITDDVRIKEVGGKLVACNKGLRRKVVSPTTQGANILPDKDSEQKKVN